jgi:hypothetical protein
VLAVEVLESISGTEQGMQEISKTIYSHEQGPAAYLNWLAALQDKPLLCTFEYPLYTDAHIVAEAQHGPYYFLNAVSIPQGVVRPATFTE